MNQFISIFWLIIAGFLASPVMAQQISPKEAARLTKSLKFGKSDINRVQTLLKLTGYYLSRTVDPKNDLDSALVMTGQAQELSDQLRYGKGKDNASFLLGKTYTKQQKINTAFGSLKSLSDTSHVKLLLEIGKSKLRPTGTVRLYFSARPKGSVQRPIIKKWMEESQSLIGVAYLLNNDWRRGKENFMKVIEPRQQRGDKSGFFS